MTKELKSIKSWLKKEGNSKSKLAGKLGYKSSQTIDNWIKRNAIPVYMIERVREVVSVRKGS